MYSLPIAAFVPNGVIKASDHNSNYSDISTALTQSLATTGVSQMTGPIKAASGTAAAPSITFASGALSGFYLAGANQIGWSANGTAAGTLNADGSVTLGGSLGVAGSLAVVGSITQGGAHMDSFATGTRILFGQVAAPTGWTQVITYHDYALRLVNGAGAGAAGTVGFLSIFNSSITNLAAHAHAITDPNHNHTDYGQGANFTYNGGVNAQPSLVASNTGSSPTGISINSSGSGAVTTFEVKYLNVILCSKN